MAVEVEEVATAVEDMVEEAMVEGQTVGEAEVCSYRVSMGSFFPSSLCVCLILIPRSI